jgi:hypothetical protein
MNACPRSLRAVRAVRGAVPPAATARSDLPMMTSNLPQLDLDQAVNSTGGDIVRASAQQSQR